ncbi:Calmodulin-interacting protein 111 [Nymphaea thermarum]|nr:Calmodulin-interacting protein 111 [Nymphaea thermarum]
MSGKQKKPAKTPSPRPSRSPVMTPVADADDARTLAALAEARLRFPSFVSSYAFAVQVAEIEPQTKFPGASIWVSESAMMASKLRSGVLVSVSLPAFKEDAIDVFPLDSLSSACGERFNLEVGDGLGDEAGNLFALATVFPSSKVPKNGAKISWSLSCTIGNPPIGRIAFVSRVETHDCDGDIGNFQPSGAPHVLLCKCVDLHLKFIPSRSSTVAEKEMVSSVAVESKRGEDGRLLSPKTPLIRRSKLPSFGSPLSEDVSNRSKEHSLLVVPEHDISIAKMDASSISSILEDEKMKELLQLVSRRWLLSRVLLPGNLVSIPMSGHMCFFRVDATNQHLACKTGKELHHFDHNLVKTAFLVVSETTAHLFSSTPAAMLENRDVRRSEKGSDKKQDIEKEDFSISKLGGLSKEFETIQEIINFSLIKRDTLSRMGILPTKGILLHGPPGTGKTSLACACVHHAGVNVFCINGPEVVSQYYGESEQALHAIFETARQAAPSVVFIDELDAIAPARRDATEDLSQRMVAALLNLMDGAMRSDGVLVIAATNRPDSIDPALRRPGRLDQEIEIGVPSPNQRGEILHCILKGMSHSLLDSEIVSLASSTHGFVGADLAALCNEAALCALDRYIKLSSTHGGGNTALFYKTDLVSSFSHLSVSSPFSSDDDKEHMHDSTIENECSASGRAEQEAYLAREYSLSVTIHDFEKARAKVRPSAMREIMLEIPKVSWDDIGGQQEVKQQLIEAVVWPQRHQDAFKRIGAPPPAGVLLFGPPGCSKTLMARAVASEAKVNFLAVKGPELFSKWVGESEKAVKSLFSKARAAAPSIIFFDEIDGLAVVRGHDGDGASVADRVITQLLVELDGLHQRVGVTVIAATNRPDKIDCALLRPGRFDRLLYVGPPNKKDREDIFHIHLRRMPCNSDVSISDLAERTEGFTGADISMVCREAAIAALEENIDALNISRSNFETALQRVPSSKSESYLELSKKFQRLVASISVGDR